MTLELGYFITQLDVLTPVDNFLRRHHPHLLPAGTLQGTFISHLEAIRSLSAILMTSVALPHKRARSRRGCWTCRQKKVKCGEEWPRCERCERLGRFCDYEPRARKRYTRKKVPAHLTPEEADVESTLPQHQSSSPDIGLQSVRLASVPDVEARGRTVRQPFQVFQGDAGRGEECNTERDHEEESSAFATPDPRVFPCEEGQVVGDDWLPTAYSATLSHSDHAAIEYFRFVFSPTQDTKDPLFSVPAILWRLAKQNDMVLHMICALGAKELNCLKGTRGQTDKTGAGKESGEQAHSPQSQIAEHYGAALHLLATAIQRIVEMVELDYILATLWLMIVYEQKFGDGCGSGLMIHLKGVGTLVQSRLQNIGLIVDQSRPCVVVEAAEAMAGPQGCVPEARWQISGFSSRMLVWISHLDGAAALNGLGGGLNQLLGEVMVGLAEDEAMSLIEGFRTIHKHSHAAFRETWGTSYPQTQLLEDLEIRQMFYLYGECGQLRYLLSLAAEANWRDVPESRGYLERVAHALNEVALRYADILETASALDLLEGCFRRRYVTNIRFVVAQYNAVLLSFFRITRRCAPLNERQRAALRVILDLAHQACSDSGEVAMHHFTWPLFVAAMESDDPVHRAWILDRFQILSTQGQNYHRANEALKTAFAEQRMNERRVSFLELVRRDDLDRFVI